MNDFQFVQSLSWLIPLIVLGVQIYMSFRQGYWGRKGQNVADKEDITKLTSLVESVKNDFAKEQAEFKSALDRVNDRTSKNFTQAQQAIIDFYVTANDWALKVTSLWIDYYEEDVLNVAFEMRRTISECNSNTYLAVRRLDILINNEECVSAALKFAREIGESYSQALGYLDEILEELKKQNPDDVLDGLINKLNSNAGSAHTKTTESRKQFREIANKYIHGN